MPDPSSSIQPLCLQIRQPLPPQKMQLTYTSALGSVKGKNEGWNLVRTLGPKNAFMAWSSVPFRSQKVMPLSTAKPFDLMEDRRVGGVGRVVAVYLARESRCAPAAVVSPWCESVPARCACAAAGGRAAGGTAVRRERSCPECRAQDVREESSALRNCSSRSRPPALRQWNIPCRGTRSRSRSSCGSRDAPPRSGPPDAGQG